MAFAKGNGFAVVIWSVLGLVAIVSMYVVIIAALLITQCMVPKPLASTELNGMSDSVLFLKYFNTGV